MKIWFREQMAMYTAYHRDVRNCATHFIGVPMIIFALLSAMSFVSIGQLSAVPITLATLFLALVLLFYCLAVQLIGVVSIVVHIPLLWYAHAVTTGSFSSAWIIIGISFVGGWIVQLIGHAYEGRRPALADNLLQAFMDPGFLVAEALFACGLLGDLKADLEMRSNKYDVVKA